MEREFNLNKYTSTTGVDQRDDGPATFEEAFFRALERDQRERLALAKRCTQVFPANTQDQSRKKP